MMSVHVEREPSIQFGRPEALFQLSQSGWLDETGSREYDTTNDGRFVMVRTEGRSGGPVEELIVVQNWVEELRKRVPLEP